MPTQSELEAQQQQIEAERLALEEEQAQIERDYQATEASRIEAEQASQADSTYFTPFADRPDYVAQDLQRRKELQYNTTLEDSRKRYEQARAGYEQRVARFQERASGFEVRIGGYNKQIEDYNTRQEEFSGYLQKVAEGKESVEDINIITHPWGYFSTPTAITGMHSGSEGHYWHEISQEQKESEAVERTKSFLGLGAEDIIRVNGRVVQESSFDPDQIKTATNIFTGRQTALAQYRRAKEEEQDILKTGMLFGQQDTAKLHGLFYQASDQNMDAGQTKAFLSANLKGSYSKDVLKELQYNVGGVTFSKPDIADQYAKQLSGLDYHPDNIVAAAPGEYGYHATPSNPAGLVQTPKVMPRDINPATGKGWAEPESALQKYEDAEKWYNKLTPSAQLSGGVATGLLSNDMFAATYQSLFENSPTAKRASDLLKHGINKTGLGTASSLIFSGKSVVPFELETAKMGGTTITYEKRKEPTPKQKFAFVFKTNIEKNFPEYEKGYTPFQAVKTGLKAATKSANIFGEDSGVLGVTIGAAGFGGGLGAASRVRVLGRPLIGTTGMKTISYGATAITGISATGKAAEGQYGSAASDVAMFAGGVPASVAGYRSVMALKPPVVEGGYRRALFGSTGIEKGGVSKQFVPGKTVTRADIIANVRKDNPVLQKMFGKSKTSSNYQPVPGKTVTRADIIANVRKDNPVLQKMFGKSKTSSNYQPGKTVTRSELVKNVQRGRTDTQKLFGVRKTSSSYSQKPISKNELTRSLKQTPTEKPSQYTGWQEGTPRYIESSKTVLIAETRPSTKSWYHFSPAKGNVIAKKNVVLKKPTGKTMKLEESLPSNWKDAPLGRSTGDVTVKSGQQMIKFKTRQHQKQSTKTILSAKKIIIKEKVSSDYVQEYAQKQRTMPKTVTKGKFKGFVLINPVEDTTVTEYDYSTTYPQKQSNIIGLRQNTATGIKSRAGVSVGNLNIMGVRTDTTSLYNQIQKQSRKQKALQRQQQKQTQFQRQESIQKQKQKQVQGLRQTSLQRQKQTTKTKLTSGLLKDMVTRQKPKGTARIIAKGTTIKLPSGSNKSLFGTRKPKNKPFSFMEYTPVAMPKSKSGKRSIWK